MKNTISHLRRLQVAVVAALLCLSGKATATPDAVSLPDAGLENCSFAFYGQTAMDSTEESSGIVFVPASCSFYNPLSVTIHAGDGQTIYYTTDGEEPSAESTLYQGAITLSSTVTLKAVAIDADGNSVGTAEAFYTCTRHGIGEDYNPASPADPNMPDTVKKVKLHIVSSPVGAGYFYGDTLMNVPVGSSIFVSAEPANSWHFVNWTLEGQEISTDATLSYVMPAYDVTIVANFNYSPVSPNDPDVVERSYPVVVRTYPQVFADISPSSSFSMKKGERRDIRVYPPSGFVVAKWYVNGDEYPSDGDQIMVTMDTKALDILAELRYSPNSPVNPNANYYNPETGEVIIDDFNAGELSTALDKLNVSYENVRSLIVKGVMKEYDFYAITSNYPNIETIDLSRTSGVEAIPDATFQCSWSGISSLMTVVLPATVSKMGYEVFYGCTNLSSIVCYAFEPPVCNNTFSEFTNAQNCTVYVPLSAIALYEEAEGWKDFTILPITDDAHVLSVNLPEECADGRYKNNTIEIRNLRTGVRQKYIVSDRLLYTFNGLQKDEQYNVYMFSQTGFEIGRIENVTIPDEDISVTFETLNMLRPVSARVLTPEEDDITADALIEWLKPEDDGTSTYLRKDVSIGEIPVGQKLLCRVTLGQKSGMLYRNPDVREITVADTTDIIDVNVDAFRTVGLSGKVVDADGASLAGASVSVNQTLNGKYYKTYTAKTDKDGQWSLSVFDAPETRITYAASECINVNDTIAAFEADVPTLDLGEKMLRSIVGARITYAFTYHEAGVETEESYYADYQNVVISVFNVTQNRPHDEVSLQYPILAVLDENIQTDDVLKLTATSKTGAFNPIEKNVTVGANQRAEVTFDIVGKGGIAASFEMTSNPSVIGLLYKANGEFLKKALYSEAALKFTGLDDGEYTLVTMGNSDLMSSVLRLSNFKEIGLTEGKDYVQNSLTVESGKLSEVKNTEIPILDESLFCYTGSTTGFSTNKSSITTGNYLTLRSTINFKNNYKDDVSNVALIVDLPEECDFVEQSVIQGQNLLPYTFDNNRLTIQLGNNYTSQVRFCVVPTAGGTFNATASVGFDYNGKTLTQPIGSAISEIKDIEIAVPSVIASPTFKVTGLSLSNSDVRVYEDGVLLGAGKANAAGSWTVECELRDPYNLSKHSIYAEITTPSNNTLLSETKNLTYDINALQVSKVTMYHWNPEMNQTYESVFDFLNPKTTPTQWTVYYPKKQFTYTIEFTNNDPERISNVVLYVHTADGKFVPCPASYDEKKGFWYAEINMGSSSNGYYPVNCSVDFDYLCTNAKVDTREMDDIRENGGQFMTNYGILMNDVTSLVSKEDLVSYEDWQNFYESNGLDIGQVDGDIEFPEDFDTWPESEQTAFLTSIDTELQEELESLNQEFASYQNMFVIDSEKNSLQFGDGSSISVKSCDGITVESLLEQGFTAYDCMNGSTIYIYISSEKNIFVDFGNDMYVETSGALLEELGLGDDFISLIKTMYHAYAKWDESNVGQCINVLAEIIGVFENANIKLENLLRSGEVELWSKTTNWLNTLSHQQGRYRQLLNKGGEIYSKKLNNVMAKKALVQGFRSCIKPAFKLLKSALPIYNWISIVVDTKNKTSDIENIYSLIEAKTCLTPEEREDFITQDQLLLSRIGVYVAGTIIPTVWGDAEIFGGVLGTMETGGTSLGVSVMGFVLKSVAQITTILLDNQLSNDIQQLKLAINAVECPDDNKNKDNNNKSGGGANQSGSINDNVQIDPSGYVYEAVPSNRVEGVQASIYYKETKEDMYGDLHDEVVLWNAEEYAQQNPLFTDENGMYRWDVPQGLWQVKFEKDGYVTAYSDWLPVPPPQLDVNIAIVQNRQPEVVSARAYELGVEIQFDKYMDSTTLTPDNIFVTANGEKVAGEIVFLDTEKSDVYAEQDDETAVRYTSRVRFIPEQSLTMATGEISLTVSRNVRSYAGIPMAETYTQVLDIEKEVQEIFAADVELLYGGEKQLTIYAIPYDAAVGKTLHIENSSDLIATVDTTALTIDNEGKAVITVKGELPGCAHLTFTIDDVTVTGEATIDVVTEILTIDAPQASRASGTAVYRGTKIELTTDTQDGIIWYTTDGTCPCDENGSRRKYLQPIVIDTDSVTILAMTALGNSDDVSEVVTFSYTLKRSDIDFHLSEGWTWISHNFEEAVAATEFTQDENVATILSQSKETVKDPKFGFVGTLTELLPTESYKLEASQETTVRLSRFEWNPDSSLILKGGWNWLSYPVNQTMSVSEAFEGNNIETLDYIVGQEGFAQFNGTEWEGTLTTLSPGKGYMYQSQSAKSITYNTSIVSKAAARYARRLYSSMPVIVDIHKYPQVMCVVAELFEGDNVLAPEEYRLMAFCDSECRGIGKVVNGMIMMSVYGKSGEKIDFKAMSNASELLIPVKTEVFSESMIGNVLEPYKFTINSLSDISKVDFTGGISVSVIDNMLHINGVDGDLINDIAILDMDGRKVRSFHDNPAQSDIYIDLPAGTYMVVVRCGNAYTYHKILVQ